MTGSATPPERDGADVREHRRDLDLPATTLERVVHEPRAVHRLDRRTHGVDAVTLLDAARERLKTVAIRPRDAHLDPLTALVQQTKVQPSAAQIQASMQHKDGPPFGARSLGEHDRACHRGRPSLHDIQRSRRMPR